MSASATPNLRPLAGRVRTLVHSIRFRLTLWFVVVLAIVLFGFSAFIYTRQSHEFAVETTARLESKEHLLEGYYRAALRPAFDRDHPAPVQPSSITNEMPLLQTDEVLLLIGPDGQPVQQIGSLTSSDTNGLLQIASAIHTPGTSFTYVLSDTPGLTGRAEYQFVLSVMPMGDTSRSMMMMLLGTPLDPSGQSSRLLLTLVLGSLGILAFAMLGGYWLAARVMHPVQIITRAARAIGETDLSRRLKLGTQDELGELADTFDAMLDRLQASFERQRQFTADASHELRTPLTIIELEASRALAHTRTPEEYGSALATIKSENELMSRMVNDLLTLARMDAGQTKLRSELLDLSDVALDVVERLAPLAKQKHVELIAGDLPEVSIRGDRQFLNQMLTNLVENAIKYSSPEKPHRHVMVETGCASVDGHDQAWVRVQDNGPGIPAAHIAKLFDRFYRVDEARHHDAEDGVGGPEPGGSGLGLSIVQWIVNGHGGHITLRSQVGEGSTFEVSLPLATAEVRRPAAPVRA